MARIRRRSGALYFHLFGDKFTVSSNGAIAYGFDAGSGSAANVYDFGSIGPKTPPNSTWFEYGASVNYRVSDRLLASAFVLGTAGGDCRDDAAWRRQLAILILREEDLTATFAITSTSPLIARHTPGGFTQNRICAAPPLGPPAPAAALEAAMALSRRSRLAGFSMPG